MTLNRVSLIKYAVLFYALLSLFFLVLSAARRRFGRMFFAVLLSLVLIAGTGLYAFGIEPYWIRIREVTIHDPALARPAEGLKIAHVTDIHITRGLGFREKQLIRKINSLKPDLIVFTGDMMDGTQQIPAAQNLVRQLRARLGILGIPGDTDRLVMSDQAFALAFRQAGMEVLLDEWKAIDLPGRETLWIYGTNAGLPKNKMIPLTEGRPVILMTHSPDIFDEAAERGINLVLAGDTHGGQIGIPWLVRLSRYAYRGPYMKGLFKKRQTTLSISNGVGTKSIPIRFFCPPEITLIKVKP